MHALRSGVDGLNGLYTYGNAPQFPAATYLDANYWVDVVFNSFIAAVTPANATTSVSVNANVC